MMMPSIVQDVEFAAQRLTPSVLVIMITSSGWEMTVEHQFLTVPQTLVLTEVPAWKIFTDNMMMPTKELSMQLGAIVPVPLEKFLEILLKEIGVKEFHLVKVNHV
jgi:hypothetical protein